MKKIIILSRVSTVQQSLEAQTNELKAEAKRLGYDEQHQILVENVESAIKLVEEEREGLQKLKYYIEHDKDIDCVICWEPSRLARRQAVLYSIRDYLLEKKIQLYILNPYVKLLTNDRKQIDTTASIVFSLFATISENEMSIKKERFMRAKNELRQQGKKFGGATMFGYVKNKDKKCVPHPINSQIIVDIYNHYINTDSSLYDTYLYISSKYPQLFPIVDYKKAQHKIRHFFEVETYATGNWCYPPLVTVEMRNKVLEKMSKARCKARYNCKRELLCRGKIYCGHCGRMMTGSGGNTKAYCCSTDKQHSLQINWDAADWLIWEETKSIININATVDQTNKTIEINDTIKKKNILKNQYEKVIEDIKSKIDKILNLYINNRIDDNMYNKKYDELNEENKIYEKKLKEINTEISSLKNILEETQKDIMNPKPINVESINDFETRQEFIRKYINKMIITKDEYFPEKKYITFEYTHPVLTFNSSYIYVAKNQYKRIYRINQDETEDLIYEDAKKYKRDENGKYKK